MKNLIVLVMTLLISQLVISQALYIAYPSDVLGEERNIKILKPRNYSKNTEKMYPLVIVLDGDFLFEPVAGTVDYLSYWDHMPESFVVGINQKESRYDETQINQLSGFPEPQSLQFMDFVLELRQTMIDEYRVAPFTVIIGKDITANLASFYIMRKQTPINAFIQIAPEYSSLIKEDLIDKLNQLESYQYFYAASPEHDNLLNGLFTKETDSLFDPTKNLYLKHEIIKGSNEYTVATQAIPRGLEFIFKAYKLIDEEKLLKEDLAEEAKFEGQENKKGMVTVIERTLERYRMINDLYGVDMKLRLVDLVTISNYVASKKDWDQLIDISELADKEYPELLYGHFMEGIGYEGLGRTSKAIKAFNAAYGLEPAGGITKDDVLDKIEQLQIKEKE